MQLGGLFQHEGQIAFVRSPYLKDMKVQHAHDLRNVRSVNVNLRVNLKFNLLQTHLKLSSMPNKYISQRNVRYTVMHAMMSI